MSVMDPFGEQVLESLDLHGVDVSERRVVSLFQRDSNGSLQGDNDLISILMTLFNESSGYKAQYEQIRYGRRDVFDRARENVVGEFIMLFRTHWLCNLSGRDCAPVHSDLMKLTHSENFLPFTREYLNIIIESDEFKELGGKHNNLDTFLKMYIEKVLNDSDFHRQFWWVMYIFNHMIEEYLNVNGKIRIRHYHVFNSVTNSRRNVSTQAMQEAKRKRDAEYSEKSRKDVIKRLRDRETGHHPRNLGRHPWNHRAHA